MNIAAKLLVKLWQGEIPCLFHMITGLYCPGCGGTRATMALIRGNFLQSILYNPIPAFLLFGGLWCIWAVLAEKRKSREKEDMLPRPVRQFLWLLLIVTVAGFLLKNFLLIGMGIDLHAVAAG